MFEHGFIEVHDANQNNLQHVNVKIPKDAITVFVGSVWVRQIIVSVRYDCCGVTAGVERNFSELYPAIFTKVWPA